MGNNCEAKKLVYKYVKTVCSHTQVISETLWDGLHIGNKIVGDMHMENIY